MLQNIMLYFSNSHKIVLTIKYEIHQPFTFNTIAEEQAQIRQLLLEMPDLGPTCLLMCAWRWYGPTPLDASQTN